MTKNHVDIEQLMDVDINISKSPFSSPTNYTTMFMLIGVDVAMYEPLTSLTVSAYIGDAGLKHLYNRPIFLLLHIKNIDKIYKGIDKYLRENENFVYSYVVGRNDGDYLIMYVFEFPTKYAGNYDKFLNSKYSEFSIDYKALFHKEVIINGEKQENPVYGVLFKTPKRKRWMEDFLSCYVSTTVNSPIKLDPKQEYFDAINKSYEIFRYPKN